MNNSNANANALADNLTEFIGKTILSGGMPSLANIPQMAKTGGSAVRFVTDLLGNQSSNSQASEAPTRENHQRSSMKDIISAYNTTQGLVPTGSTSVTETVTETPTSETPTSDTVMLDDDTVEYTYKQGDTFGQVIKDLGFMTDNGLWGNNGDVKYYEKQLRDQGWKGGNIPIGTKIRLRRRPAVQYDIYGNRVK